MENITLTKSADAVISALYKSFLEKHKNGKTQSLARYFGGSEYLMNEFFPTWSIDDIDESLRELHAFGLVDCFFCDDTVGELCLSSHGIAFMENRFSNNVNTVLEWLGKIRSFLP